jgi:hypothetical protein
LPASSEGEPETTRDMKRYHDASTALRGGAS